MFYLINDTFQIAVQFIRAGAGTAGQAVFIDTLKLFLQNEHFLSSKKYISIHNEFAPNHIPLQKEPSHGSPQVNPEWNLQSCIQDTPSRKHSLSTSW